MIPSFAAPIRQPAFNSDGGNPAPDIAAFIIIPGGFMEMTHSAPPIRPVLASFFLVVVVWSPVSPTLGLSATAVPSEFRTSRKLGVPSLPEFKRN
jgi:hypothetical protein